jgi:hypothetical protein
MPADPLAELEPVTAAGRDFVARIRALADAGRTSQTALVDQLGVHVAAGTNASWLTVVVDPGSAPTASHDASTRWSGVRSQ